MNKNLKAALITGGFVSFVTAVSVCHYLPPGRVLILTAGVTIAGCIGLIFWGVKGLIS